MFNLQHGARSGRIRSGLLHQLAAGWTHKNFQVGLMEIRPRMLDLMFGALPQRFSICNL